MNMYACSYTHTRVKEEGKEEKKNKNNANAVYTGSAWLHSESGTEVHGTSI